jgi:hypothetical protein
MAPSWAERTQGSCSVSKLYIYSAASMLSGWRVDGVIDRT